MRTKTIPEPERIRLVRYAADCAEHVLHSTSAARPMAEAAIAAARAWANDPCAKTRKASWAAAHAAVDVAGAYADHAVEDAASASAATDATHATLAARASFAADAAYYAAHAANDDTGRAGGDAICAARKAERASGDTSARAAERDWQAERRRHYRLRKGIV